MRPFHHARASANRSNRDWREDLAIHEFIDSTKAAWADLRHRMILHSVDLGGELAARAFPERTDAREIVKNHVLEDTGQAKTLSDWLNQCSLERLPRLHPRSLPIDENALAAAEQKRQGLADPSGPQAVLDILRLPVTLAPEFGDHTWCVLGNCFGPGLVRRLLGPPVETAGKGGSRVVFDPAWCAEAMIFSLFGTIPELRAVVTTLRPSHQREASSCHA
jgi:hypothetical protein